MIAPRLIALCQGRPMLAIEEDALPHGCAWIEPIGSLAPYLAFAIMGALALASLTITLRSALHHWRAITQELAALNERN